MPNKKKPDIGHLEADKELFKTERQLSKLYRESYESLKREADEYFEYFEQEEKRMLRKLDLGEISSQEFIDWREDEMIRNKRFDVLVDSLSEELTKTNQMARDITNGHLADIYASNYNYAGFEICQQSGINLRFDLVDRRTVEKLVKEDKPLLPTKGKVNKKKDVAWNEKKIRSALTQGVIRGDSIDKIANSLKQVTKMSDEASVRNARTMTTAAENAGRQDRYEEAAEKYGIQMQKTWLATLDDRTRDAHAELDGVSVDIDQDFKNSIGRIAYPGDPDADGENVYNCRCTMISSIKGYTKDLSRREMGKGIENMTYDQWKKEATDRAKEKADKKNG